MRTVFPDIERGVSVLVTILQRDPCQLLIDIADVIVPDRIVFDEPGTADTCPAQRLIVSTYTYLVLVVAIIAPCQKIVSVEWSAVIRRIDEVKD